MSADKKNHADRLIEQYATEEVPQDVEQLLRGRLEVFRGQMDERDRNATQPHQHRLMTFPRLAWAGGFGLAALAVLVLITSLPSHSTWAQVIQSFRSVKFYHAMIYFRDDALGKAEQYELWQGEGGRARMKRGGRVFFANADESIRGFDVARNREIDIAQGGEARSMLRLLKIWMQSGEEFSLDAVLKSFPGELKDATPIVNKDAGISGDLTVFDLVASNTPEWMRVWVLRESRLPIRLVSWDPRDGESIDVSFTYTISQEDRFFDPDAFTAALNKSQSRTARAYALMKDPGGRAITSENLFETTGYHVPVVREAGITPEGIVWVAAGESRNR